MPLRVPSVFAFLGLCALIASCTIVASLYFYHHSYIKHENIKKGREIAPASMLAVLRASVPASTPVVKPRAIVSTSTSVVKQQRATKLPVIDVLCSGTRPILRCVRKTAPTSLPVLDGVKSWKYRLANNADFSRYKQLSSRHETCALVGSSYNLIKNEFGAEIDSRDLVVRLNDPPVKGYEKHVGARPADISVFNYVMAKTLKKCAEPPRNGSLMVQCSFAVDKDDDNTSAGAINTQCAESTWKKYGLKTYFMSSYVFGAAERALAHQPMLQSTKAKKYKPTCGLRSIFFLLDLCKNLHLYGFGGTTDKDPYKYYLNSTTKYVYEKSIHDFVGESHFIDDFAKSANLSAFGLLWNGSLIVHR
ncbi:CMP-N-acetylneuraminate-beta-galactosamide-alpha-2,3-sialyltransferase 2-like [Oscarella lobularis]|uniref:CMP-N-acetylneuraminate-beta-galactosamide- alpha-2,3-sialyltransferase 2-like n=1 Tax=Oscarella lobularis TaxID=121494 RepID=UPI003313BA56